MSILLVHSERGKNVVARLNHCDLMLAEALKKPGLTDADLRALREVRAQGLASLSLIKDATVGEHVKLSGFDDLLSLAEEYCVAVESEFQKSAQ